jgi:hypothetical protein
VAPAFAQFSAAASARTIRNRFAEGSGIGVLVCSSTPTPGFALRVADQRVVRRRDSAGPAAQRLPEGLRAAPPPAAAAARRLRGVLGDDVSVAVPGRVVGRVGVVRLVQRRGAGVAVQQDGRGADAVLEVLGEQVDRRARPSRDCPARSPTPAGRRRRPARRAARPRARGGEPAARAAARLRMAQARREPASCSRPPPSADRGRGDGADVHRHPLDSVSEGRRPARGDHPVSPSNAFH